MKNMLIVDRIETKILLVRGEKVMIDADLAQIYGVKTKILNQAVKRNKSRFPEDFMFKLTKKEKDEVVTNCDHLKKIKYSPNLPYVFTEHGAIMLATILSSATAVSASINVVRAFVRLRKILATNKQLAQKIDEMEKKYDSQFKGVFQAIRILIETPKKDIGRMGFVKGK